MAGKNRRAKRPRRRTEHLSRPKADQLSAFRAQLADHLCVLRMANSSLMVCVQALQQQNAEMDADIARVLQRHVSDPLDAETEKWEMFSPSAKDLLPFPGAGTSMERQEES